MGVTISKGKPSQAQQIAALEAQVAELKKSTGGQSNAQEVWDDMAAAYQEGVETA